jgi:hypothetical protein
MPINSRDVQFGAAIGFIVIVGIVAIYFGFSTKLVLALLAGLGILFCASLVEGYVRAAMLGTGALLLLLIAYDLATSCDSACQQTRAEAAQQKAAQQQAQLAAEQARQSTMTPQLAAICTGVKSSPLPIGREPVRVNPNGNCQAIIFAPGHCIQVKQANEQEWNSETFCDIDGDPRKKALPLDVEYIRNSGTETFDYQVRLNPPKYIDLFH